MTRRFAVLPLFLVLLTCASRSSRCPTSMPSLLDNYQHAFGDAAWFTGAVVHREHHISIVAPSEIETRADVIAVRLSVPTGKTCSSSAELVASITAAPYAMVSGYGRYVDTGDGLQFELYCLCSAIPFDPTEQLRHRISHYAIR